MTTKRKVIPDDLLVDAIKKHTLAMCPLSYRDLAEYAGIAESTAYMAMQRLIASGRVTTAVNGRGYIVEESEAG